MFFIAELVYVPTQNQLVILNFFNIYAKDCITRTFQTLTFLN